MLHLRGGMSGEGREWLETDGWGGFASGTADLVRTRRYHGLLLVAARPPADRWMLVNGWEGWLVGAQGERLPLTSQAYRDVVYPNGREYLEVFAHEPWPRWSYRIDEETRLDVELIVPGEGPGTVLSFSLHGGTERWRSIDLRLLCSGRDPHHLRSADGDPKVGLEVAGCRLGYELNPGAPPFFVWGAHKYRHAPEWFRQFEYAEERARGLDAYEDLLSPGHFELDLREGAAALILSTAANFGPRCGTDAVGFAEHCKERVRERSARRRDRLGRAASAYVSRRGDGHTVIAGYPWFGDWGRDTFIALRGLRHLPEGRELESSILLEWSQVVSRGMLPNRFPDRGDTPEYNSVDASLWYVLAVRDHLATAETDAPTESRLWEAARSILEGYLQGTRHGIGLDVDGLIRAGEPGVQLTWMDAKVGDWVVTPRIGKPVEIQALWLAALAFAVAREAGLARHLERGRASFAEKFFDPERGWLRDVVDVDHEPNRMDPRLRPNQVFALGGLGPDLLSPGQAHSALDAVERILWTPAGLRTLDPSETEYRARYEGGVWERDGAYHQGTVWPWLTGPFVDAWVHLRGGGPDVQRAARNRFVAPLLTQLDRAGLGHISEIADGEAPHTPRGAPFQAWSVTELFRLDRTLAR